MNSINIITLLLMVEIAAIARAYRKHRVNPQKSFIDYLLIANALYGALAIAILVIEFADIKTIVYVIAGEDKKIFADLFRQHKNEITHIAFNTTFLIFTILAIIEITRNLLSVIYFPSKNHETIVH